MARAKRVENGLSSSTISRERSLKAARGSFSARGMASAPGADIPVCVSIDAPPVSSCLFSTLYRCRVALRQGLRNTEFGSLPGRRAALEDGPRPGDPHDGAAYSGLRGIRERELGARPLDQGLGDEEPE